MLKKSITYTDFNGLERTEDFYFNVSKSELLEKELSGEDNSYRGQLQKIISANIGKDIMREFKSFILDSYGEKSADGKRFVKTPELSEAFSQTGAYDVLFEKVCTDAEEASAFVNGIMPQALADEVAAEQAQTVLTAREQAAAAGATVPQDYQKPQEIPVTNEPVQPNAAIKPFVPPVPPNYAPTPDQIQAYLNAQQNTPQQLPNGLSNG